MSDVPVPDEANTGGPLPFSEAADLLAQGGAVIMAVASSPPWPAGSQTTRTGQAYDHTAELEHSPALVAELIGQANRKLRVDGVTYAVIEAVANDFVPHVAVNLRVQRGG